MKFIFTWNVSDGYTYSFDVDVPFECDDLDKFIYERIDQLQRSDFGCEILGIWVEKDNLDNLEHSFFSLEDWFEMKKYTQRGSDL